MSKTITPDQIQLVKTAAKRLKKSLPDAKLQKCQDIAAYQFLGVSSFHEAVALSKAAAAAAQPSPESDSQQYENPDVNADPWRQKGKVSYAEHTGLVPAHSVGDWNYFTEDHTLSFDGEYLPYAFSLNRLTTTARLLDIILQLEKKRWPRREAEENGISPHYQVQEFLELMNDLSEAYLGTSLQGAFSPGGKPQVVDWAAAIEQHGEAALTARIAKKTEYVRRFGL
ncbi:hypothetical protein [Salinicola sp. NYA28a]